MSNKPLPQLVVPDDFGPGHWNLNVMRGRSLDMTVHHGPNVWTMLVVHPDGSMEPPVQGENLLTTVGRDLIAAGYGNPTGKDGALTASSATSATPAGGGMTTDQYKGWRVFAPVTGLTTAPVYGNIGSNSTTVLTVDGWWVGTSDTMTGTTPASTNGYHVQPSVLSRFMALTENAGAPAAGDTVLTGELTTGGCSRAKATYAHTPAAATYTLQNTFAVTATFPAIHKGALFTAANSTAAGVMVFEAVLNADASVINLDSLQVTATVTLT
jgi:hypothetical protein